MRTLVSALVRWDALHHWPDALPEVRFLCHPHRHLFHVRAWREVQHHDREVEILTLGKEVAGALARMAPRGDFGPLSCEHIAARLLVHLNLARCEVLEDGENGAEVTA